MSTDNVLRWHLTWSVGWVSSWSGAINQSQFFNQRLYVILLILDKCVNQIGQYTLACLHFESPLFQILVPINSNMTTQYHIKYYLGVRILILICLIQLTPTILKYRVFQNFVKIRVSSHQILAFELTGWKSRLGNHCGSCNNGPNYTKHILSGRS